MLSDDSRVNNFNFQKVYLRCVSRQFVLWQGVTHSVETTVRKGKRQRTSGVLFVLLLSINMSSNDKYKGLPRALAVKQPSHRESHVLRY